MYDEPRIERWVTSDREMVMGFFHLVHLLEAEAPRNRVIAAFRYGNVEPTGGIPMQSILAEMGGSEELCRCGCRVWTFPDAVASVRANERGSVHRCRLEPGEKPTGPSNERIWE